MGWGYPEIAILCRELSIQKMGKYTAVCDYYGVLDSVQATVIHRDTPWPEADAVFSMDIKLSNQADINTAVTLLKGFL
jgi:hypothetical protein